MENTLKEINLLKIKQIGRKFDLRFLILYGSGAIGNLNDESDIDIAYFGKSNLSFKQHLKLSSDITDALGVGFRTLDLVDLKTTNQLLRYEVILRGKLLYGDESDFASYQVYAFMEYMDGESLRTLERTMINRRQKALAGVL